MNEVIRQLAARRSVRAFEDRDIPGEVRAAILEAAAQAPTAGNQQLYTILESNRGKPLLFRVLLLADCCCTYQ